MSRTIHSDALEQVHELNRLFLDLLQRSGNDGLARMRFPSEAREALRSADAFQIEAAAEFPRALFRIRIAATPASASPALNADFDARQILELTLLYCVWTTCRESTYQARLFFGLSPREVHALRTTPLSDLPVLASASLSLACAFGDSAWLWRELLTETRPEVRRQLILVALQPPAEAARFEAGGRAADRARTR
ncbi:MAG TPA: hypothetical protein VFY39_15700 [Gammaproteobacteria bacterium]|nr:hypothetical protein [Gammaproteobacteria bacterium]